MNFLLLVLERECLAVFKLERTRAKSSKSIFQVSDRDASPASVNIKIIGAKVRIKMKNEERRGKNF